jgi:hypothetical protein
VPEQQVLALERWVPERQVLALEALGCLGVTVLISALCILPQPDTVLTLLLHTVWVVATARTLLLRIKDTALGSEPEMLAGGAQGTMRSWGTA